MKDNVAENMSATAEHAPGLLRPIPIHLAPLSGLDGHKFRFPISSEKPARPNPPLWNPALDLRSSSRENISTGEVNIPKKLQLSEPQSLSLTFSASETDVDSASARLSQQTLTAGNFLKTAPSTIDVLKASPMVGTLIYEQLQRRFPMNLESPLAVLASKGLFPTLIGAHEPTLVHAAHSAATTHHNLSISLSERHMALQNAFAFAQNRAVIERVTSSHPADPRRTLEHLQQSQSFHLHQSRHPQQNSPNSQQLVNPQTRQSVSATERPNSLHSAFSHTHSRALLERISNNAILSPVISLESSVTHGYGRKLFPCPQCRYTTDRRNNLKRHMLTMHQTSSKMLECCGILFNTKASLREHAMIFHYHGYTCYFCGRRFCRKALLKRHLSVHNGQKDFVCNVCDYATSHKSNLERHRKVHSRQDDGKDGNVHRYNDDAHHYHDDVKSSGSEALSHDDVSSDDLSVCSDYDDDIDVEINVHSD